MRKFFLECVATGAPNTNSELMAKVLFIPVAYGLFSRWGFNDTLATQCNKVMRFKQGQKAMFKMLASNF